MDEGGRSAIEIGPGKKKSVKTRKRGGREMSKFQK